MADKRLFHNDVWDRANDATPATMSRRVYLIAVTGFTAVGIAVSATAAQWAGSTINLAAIGRWGVIGFVLVVFLIALGATWVAASSDDPLLGLLLLLIVGQFGVLFLGMLGVPVAGAMTALDWLGLALFSALVIFDLNRALRFRTHWTMLSTAPWRCILTSLTSSSDCLACLVRRSEVPLGTPACAARGGSRAF